MTRSSSDLASQAWEPGDLVRRLCGALDLAAQAIERLGERGYVDPREPGNSLRSEKLVAETARLLLAASTAGHHAELTSRIAQLAPRLIPYARSDRMLLGLCLEPAIAFDHAQAHVCLTRLGYRDARVDHLLRQAAEAHARAGRERPPHRMLEQEWTHRGWRTARAPSRATVASTARISALNHPMDLFTSSRDDVYAFTHAVMYVSDFNLAPRALPRPRSAILGDAEAALARCLDEQDYDLAGEVLLAWPLTGKTWSAGSAFGFQVLARVEDAAGGLPAPSSRLDQLAQLPTEERGDYLLATAYHTAYVMGLLCAAALSPGCAPPRAPSGARHASVGGAARLVAWLDEHGTRSHWRDDFDRLEPSQRDALTELLFVMALRRAVQQRGFAELHRLLELGARLGLAGTPAARQAGELLARLASYSAILGERGEREREAQDVDDRGSADGRLAS